LHWQFPELSRSRVTRLLKRLRLHGLLRKIGHTYTYYVTRLGQRVLISVLHLKHKLFESLLTSKSAVA
jgi:DNA-binding IclR family transcriptional regulator